MAQLGVSAIASSHPSDRHVTVSSFASHSRYPTKPFVFVDMGALSSTSPIQNSAESPTGANELTDKITVEQVPKPRKFFKSRNAAPTAEIQQQMVMQQQASFHQQQNSYQNHHPAQYDHNQYPSGADDEVQTPKRGKKKKLVTKVEKLPKPPKPQKPQKVAKPKKEKKIKVKEIPEAVSDSAQSEPETPSRRGRAQIEPTRSSGRSRARCVNYNEDAGEDEFYTRIERRIVPKHLVPATITSVNGPSVDTPPVTIEVPLPQQSPVLHPPIVLRISKVSVTSVL